ncbi:MAG: sigma-70 family RNA polymerase sigma factor [Phycisphaeraceae bacterium]|nr:MAG: sigma-70 family RNA polymerase sigma factor [Phycisphaeraceae bacterium]
MTSEPQNSPVDPDELARLRDAAAGGDEEAVETLLCVYHSRLYGFAKRKIGVDWQGKIEPEDILQEAYIDIFRGLADFEDRGEDSFYHWATRIVDHRFIDHVRRLRRQKRDVARETPTGAAASRRESLLARCGGLDPSPSRIVRKDDAVGAMMGCIARLPEEHREVVTRLYLEEEPLAQVAAAMGKTEDAVRRMAGRAVEKLRDGMGRASRYLSQW